jgi:excisionase family DNA binding protein
VNNVIPITGRTRRHLAADPARPSTTASTDPTYDKAAPLVNLATITRAVYTVAEVAELLSLSLGSTYAMVRSGDIPARKLGGRWVVPKRRFHAWLDDLPEATDDDVIREIGRPSP